MENSFKVRAVGANGNIIEEVISADAISDVISILESKNLKPIDIKPHQQSANINLNFRQGVKLSDLAVFCKQLSAMLNAGMPINRALDIQEKQTENQTLRTTLQEISIGVKKGENLSRTLRTYPKIFPKMMVSLIESGEATGNLDEVLARLSDNYDNENKTSNKIKGALMYPIILAVVMIVVVIVLMVFVVPTITGMFTDGGKKLPWMTAVVVGLSDFIKDYWPIHLVILGGSAIGIKKYLDTREGKRNFDKFKLNNPILKGPMQQIITARFTRTLSTLLASGISIIDALVISADTSDNIIVQEGVGQAVEGIKKGYSLTGELIKTNLFPGMMTSMVGIGEETGTIDDLLNKTANYYDEELDAAISRLLSMIEPIMIIIMGVVVGFVVIAMMLPIFEMSSGGLM